MESVTSIAIKSALLAGVGAGIMLAVARQAVGARPSLVQDFSYTIGGAFIGEIIGVIGPHLVGKLTTDMNPNACSAISFITFIGGCAGLAIGTTAGAVASVAQSYFNT